jgi:hypothetical protein
VSNYEVWTYDGSRPELLTSTPATLLAARTWTRNSKHAAIVRDGRIVDVKLGSDAGRIDTIRKAVLGGAKPTAPVVRVAFFDVPHVEVADAAEPVAELPPSPAPSPAKPTRPAAVRPPLPRRQVAPVPCVDDELALMRRRIEQLTGEVESIKSELALARAEASNATARAEESERGDSRRLDELLAIGAAVGCAPHATGAEILAAVTRTLGEARELRAQIHEVTVDAGERIATLEADLDDAQRLRPTASTPPVALNHQALAAMVTRAVREGLPSTREERALRALAESVGGVARLRAIVAGSRRLLGRVQP